MKKNINFKKILRSAKLKKTTPRIAILKVLSKTKHPETTQEIYKKLKKTGIDLTTLYRTLASFEKSGLVRKVDLHKDTIYYESNLSHHHHIICTKCNKIEDFENLEIEKVLKQIIKKSSKFKDIKNHSLELFGFCRGCA